jgi:hypothetical protein
VTKKEEGERGEEMGPEGEEKAFFAEPEGRGIGVCATKPKFAGFDGLKKRTQGVVWGELKIRSQETSLTGRGSEGVGRAWRRPTKAEVRYGTSPDELTIY